MRCTFTKESYDYLKKVIETGKIKDDYLGAITEGAVCCDIVVREDEGYDGEDYCYGGKFIIDCDFYLLGKDTGYGETENGTPYDCVSGFYGRLKDTYEETVNGLVKQFTELTSEDPELKAGIFNTELTWDKELGQERGRRIKMDKTCVFDFTFFYQTKKGRYGIVKADSLLEAADRVNDFYGKADECDNLVCVMKYNNDYGVVEIDKLVKM